MDIPRIISVDDHVVEPPDLWTSASPPSSWTGARGSSATRRCSIRGRRVLLREGPRRRRAVRLVARRRPHLPVPPAVGRVGFAELDVSDHVRRDPSRVLDKLRAPRRHGRQPHGGVVCFPNTLPRFCGQTFLERDDKELALLCVKAYNDWIIDEWCAGDGRGRLIPLTIVPLWDAELAAAEIRRCAAKGSYAVTFPENPYPLGLPSIHDEDRYWDPFFPACQETDTRSACTSARRRRCRRRRPTRRSSSAPRSRSRTPWARCATTSSRARSSGSRRSRSRTPRARSAGCPTSWSGPTSSRRAVRQQLRLASAAAADELHAPDLRLHLRRRDRPRQPRRIGMDQICFETDYPHADSTFPHSKKSRGHLHPGRAQRGGALQAAARATRSRRRPVAVRHHQGRKRVRTRARRRRRRRRPDDHDQPARGQERAHCCHARWGSAS